MLDLNHVDLHIVSYISLPLLYIVGNCDTDSGCLEYFVDT